MKPKTLKELKQLSTEVKWNGFNKDSFGSIMSLKMKLMKHAAAGNEKKCKMYIALCIQQWPVFKECPIDQSLLKEALNVIEETR